MPTFPGPRRSGAAGLSVAQRAGLRNAAHRRHYGQGHQLLYSTSQIVGRNPASSAALVGIADAFTVGCWVRPSALGRCALSVGGNEANYIGVRIEANGAMGGQVNPNAGGFGKLWGTTASGIISVNEWYHLVLTWNTEDDFRFSVNGERIPDADITKSVDNSNGARIDTSRAISLGTPGGSFLTGFAGLYHSAFIFNTPLSSAAIRSLYNQGKGALVDLRYPFGEYAEPHRLMHYYRNAEDVALLASANTIRDLGYATTAHDVSDGDLDETHVTSASPL